MKIGVIKEIKDMESRVALTPCGARELIAAGHDIFLEDNAGLGSGYNNNEYESVGVNIATKEEAWDVELVIKIKEPLEQEFQYLKNNILFAYLHLSGVPKSLTKALIAARTTSIAYETVENDEGHFPLLAPMSAVAGNMATIIGAYYLAKFNQGKGTQLGRVLGKRHGKVMVIGNGVVGQHAASTAADLGADVFILERGETLLNRDEKSLADNMTFVLSTPENIETHIRDTDLLIGAVLLPGAKTPHLVSEAMVKQMQPGSVIVDVAIDQGGCIETSHVTSHSEPVYIKHGVLHYGVSNMPGAYPRTSTIALTHATLPYIIKLANEGVKALKRDNNFATGVSTHNGYITCKAVAESLVLNKLFCAFTDID